MEKVTNKKHIVRKMGKTDIKTGSNKSTQRYE